MRYNNLQGILLFLVIMATVSGCSFTDEKPDNLIPSETMADVLADIHIAEAKVSRLNLRSTDSSGIVYKRFENQILKKFKVDTSAYTKSYVYYSSHPADFEALYKRVTEKLQKRVDAGKKSGNRPKAVVDSIKKV